MTDRARSEAAMLSSLHDIQLPELAPGGVAADIAVTVGLAALAALLVAGLLRLVSIKRGTRPQDGLQAELIRLRSQPEAARRVALLHMLRERAPDRYARVKGALYRPDGGIDTDALEAEVGRLV